MFSLKTSGFQKEIITMSRKRCMLSEDYTPFYTQRAACTGGEQMASSTRSATAPALPRPCWGKSPAGLSMVFWFTRGVSILMQLGKFREL